MRSIPRTTISTRRGPVVRSQRAAPCFRSTCGPEPGSCARDQSERVGATKPDAELDHDRVVAPPSLVLLELRADRDRKLAQCDVDEAHRAEPRIAVVIAAEPDDHPRRV